MCREFAPRRVRKGDDMLLPVCWWQRPQRWLAWSLLRTARRDPAPGSKRAPAKASAINRAARGQPQYRLPSVLFCVATAGYGKRPQWFRLGPALMRILIAITFAVCSLVVSGCSRWCSCAADRPPLAPQEYGQGAYSNSYALPEGNSYERGYSDSNEPQPPPNYGQDPRTRPSAPYLASP